VGVVGKVDWGGHDGDRVEEVLSVMLLQERPNAWRRRPSQGDAGVDVAQAVRGEGTVADMRTAEPGGIVGAIEGFDVAQIKSFTGK
jgi:hypothetical protein